MKVNSSFRKIDYQLSKSIYDLFDGTAIKYIPNYLGLIPYEIYVLPGMYLAILQVVWLGTPNPIQFHLLPHFFAYSIFQLLKGSINTPRPGCHIKGMNKYIDKGHCSHGHEWQSFPSGHSGISASLATALFMEMMYSDDPHFFEINITDIKTRRLIAFSGIFIAAMMIVHRVSKGYHSLFDSITGALIGITIGFISWTSMEYYKKYYHKLCDKTTNDKLCENHKFTKENKEFSYWFKDYNILKMKLFDFDNQYDKKLNLVIGISRVLISIPVIYLLFKFLTKDIFKLATIKH